MTPKEKAIELIEKMREEIPCHCDDWEQAKQCALIAVDEVLGYMGADRGTEFWVEVKNEIEKL